MSLTKDETKKNSCCFIFASRYGDITLCFRFDLVQMLMTPMNETEIAEYLHITYN